MKQKESAGLAIIYNGMVLLAHTTGRKWWGSYGIPKGGIEPGESRIDAAIRETREEVGLDIPRSMIDPNPRTYVLTSRKYKYTKTVYWYTVQVEDLGQIGMKSLVVPKSRLQLEEVDWAGFMPLAEAKKRAMSSQQQLLTQLIGLGLLESRHSKEIYKTEHQKKPSTMKYVKLFEQFVNEGYYSSSDIKKLKEFAKEVSEEIIRDYSLADSRYFKAKDYSPKKMFDYISEWGEINDMSAEEVIAEFNWNYMTDELGLPRG